MIKITRQEAEAIRKQLPNVNVVTVNKTKSYKKYWAEETRESTRLLNQMRGVKMPQRQNPRNNRRGDR